MSMLRVRSAKAAAGVVLATALVLAGAGCGGGGDDTAGSGGTEQTSASGGGSEATTDTTAGGDPGTSTAPAEVPDPCTLLTGAEAETLGGTSGLSAAPADPDSFLDKACVWSDSNDSAFVRVEIGAVASDVAGFTETYLDNERGDPVDGVGDGAKLDPSYPARIVVGSGPFVFTIEVSNTEVDTAELVAVAKEVDAGLS